ncbi:MAG: hypothetical protein O9327_03445 [Polaromonas sp.]|nr:hypothetical protein [Polaromonas sp.]
MNTSATDQANSKRSSGRFLSRLFGRHVPTREQRIEQEQLADVSDSMFMELPDAWRPTDAGPAEPMPASTAPSPSQLAKPTKASVPPAAPVPAWMKAVQAGATKPMMSGLTALLNERPKARHDYRALVFVEKTMELTSRLTGENGLLKVKPDILRRALAQMESLGLPASLSPLREAMLVVLENTPETVAPPPPESVPFATSSLLDSRTFEDSRPTPISHRSPSASRQSEQDRPRFQRSSPPPHDDEIVSGFADTVPMDLLDLAISKRNEQSVTLEEAQDALASVFDCHLTSGITDQDVGFSGITSGQLKGIDAEPITVFSALDGLLESIPSVAAHEPAPPIQPPSDIPVLADVVDIPGSNDMASIAMDTRAKVDPPAPDQSPTRPVSPSSAPLNPSALHLLRQFETEPDAGQGLALQIDPRLQDWADTDFDESSVARLVPAIEESLESTFAVRL